jgi:hypothetical protein
MSYQDTAQHHGPAAGHRGFRVLALAAVVAGLLVLAAAAFVLSYAGIHVVALSSGVSPKVARVYPLIFDAMLVVTCAAVLSLRGAGVPSRLFAWLSMLALFAAAAGADTLNATGVRMPHRPAAAAAAIIPWALVLIGFGLLMCMLRQARLRRGAALAQVPQTVAPERAGRVEVRAGIQDLMGATASQTGAPGRSGTGRAEASPDPAWDLAIDTDPGQDDPASDEGLGWPARPSDEHEFAAADGADGSASAFSLADQASALSLDRQASAFSPAPTTPLESDTGGPPHDAEAGPAPEEIEDALPGLAALAMPQAAAGVSPAMQVPPHPRPAPDESPAGPLPVPDLAAPPQTDPDLVPGATARPDTDPHPAPAEAAPPQADAGTARGGAAGHQSGSWGAPDEADDPPPDPQPAPDPAPDTPPAVPVPPQPRPAPEAAARPQPAAPAAPALTAEPREGAGGESAPEAQAQEETGAMPDTMVTADTVATSNAAAAADTTSDARVTADTTSDARVTADTTSDARVTADVIVTPEAGASPDPGGAPDPSGTSDASDTGGSRDTDGADTPTETVAETTRAAAQFDRMRSSPVPPEE